MSARGKPADTLVTIREFRAQIREIAALMNGALGDRDDPAALSARRARLVRMAKEWMKSVHDSPINNAEEVLLLLALLDERLQSAFEHVERKRARDEASA